MLTQPLKALVLLFLWGALVEDATIFALAWLAPDMWFRLFHHAQPAGLETALLRRAAGQWAAFAAVQAIALLRWRAQPIWFMVVAGLRASDLLTDLSYVVAVPSLTTLGWLALTPPAFLNAAFIVTMALAHGQSTSRAAP
ncbi:MAG TPA: hypothetical protein VIP05_09445 [Burkholderiaceae bacterium]